jgi:two-component system cell cycle sensor histidine kinase/response regulator CckA
MIPRLRPLKLDAAPMLEALEGAACLAGLDGSILAANGIWREMFGPSRRTPSLLHGAFKTARDGGRGVERQGDRRFVVTAAGDGRFLVQATVESTKAAPRAPAVLESFAAASPFGVALIAGADLPTGIAIDVNLAMTALVGPQAKPGVRLTDLIGETGARELAHQMQAGHAGPIEVALEPDRTVQLHIAPSERGTLVYLQDVTDQKRLQSRLAQRNRMESVGQLAGGVAHDFNNLLSAIRLRTDELLLRHALGDPSYDSLAEIRETVGRAASVVRQLLTFSRRATLQREALDLGEALTDAAVLLRRLVREDVKLEIDYGPNLPLVRIDRSQLETAIINLVVNARDALRAQGGGVVRISTARLPLAAARELGYAGLDLAEVAFIEVADNGPGIAPEALGKIFEPFFTTKPAGEGTGLGLATVYGVVKQADGWISAESRPGEGARFRIFLPVHTPPLTFEPGIGAAPRRAAARDLSGAGRILFVEDENLVRGVAARLLRARGYEVLEAADGEAALALAKDNAGAIDLMISDVIMPGMDGPALLKAARPFIGDAPVMFVSGYAEAEFSDLLEGESNVSFLAKPLDIKTLAERVKAHLRPPPDQAA